MPVLQLDNRREPLVKEDAPCHLDLSKLIQAGTRTFFNNPALSDLTLVCPDGRALHCHSIILAAASRRFAAALKQGNWTPGQQMPVKGVDSYALETLVCAFYTAECPLELGRVPALYDAAVKLEVPSLAPALEQYLNSALQPHNCCQVLELCLNLGVLQLADLALEWIRGRIADVVPSAEFRASRLETAAYICKDLAQRSQLVGLQAAVSWLSATSGRSSLMGVFAEATGLSIDAIQAVAVSGAALGPMGQGGGANGGGGALQLSHAGYGLGHAGPILGPMGGVGSGPTLNLQAQGLGLSHGGAEPPLGGGLDLGSSGGIGSGGLGLSLGNNGGGGASLQVLQLLPTASGSQAVLVMPPNGTGALAPGVENGHHGHAHNTHDSLGLGGLQSLLSLHGGSGCKAGGGGKAGGGLGGGLGRGSLGIGISEASSGPVGFGLDALADAAEGERVQKRLRAACAGGGLAGSPAGAGAFAATAAESGSATSMHSDMSGDGKRAAAHGDLQLMHRMQRDAGQILQQKQPQHIAVNHNSQQQQQKHQLPQQKQQQQGQQQVQQPMQQQRGKSQGGRSTGTRRKRGASISDDDEDYAPSGGRRAGVGGAGAGGSAGGGGSGARSREKELVYDSEMPVDGSLTAAGEAGPQGNDSTAVAYGSAGSGHSHGDDDAGGQAGCGDAGDGVSAKADGVVSGGAGGGGSGNVQGGTPVLMTGRRAPSQKGMCHVQGCHRSLQGLRDYYQRYKICEHHLKVSSVLKDGVPHRFCQQCGRFHPLSEFDGDRRSCRTMLQRHCHRRAKQKQELAEVLAQRFEDQVAASMSAMVAAMARNAQVGGNVGGLTPMLQLQYLGGLPAGATLDEDQLGALGAAAAMTAGRSGGSSAGSDGSGASAKTGVATAAGAGNGGGGGGSGGRSRGLLPPGLHSPPSKAQLLEAVQRARKQHVHTQQHLLGLAADVPLAAALAAAAVVAGGDIDGDGHGGAIDDVLPGSGGGGGREAIGRGGSGRYAAAMLQGTELGYASGSCVSDAPCGTDGGGATMLLRREVDGQAGGDEAAGEYAN
ncbi:hypothetical protein VaNZ11_015371 [Volvox africanus]|uniref:BTB domain-containing protein n=1 Tax=Volvox africanus TaxID=51714 RepID=A0ABQ5SMV4_9CHLO|nr:hypothetical protein VaNZ11_015371 [Volvox africanus]